MNARWHASHVMPKPATLDQRVRWHVAHAKQCGCRAMPASVVAELRRRGVDTPERKVSADGRRAKA